jgi:hypothetical protein
MLAWLQQSVNFTEELLEGKFAPVRADYYTGPPGKPLRLLLQARTDFLSIWRASDYTETISQTRILGRQIIVVNSPDLIRQVVVKRHENFERKSPQMRRALEFLLGDGLFISDGDTWKQRRGSPLSGPSWKIRPANWSSAGTACPMAPRSTRCTKWRG